MNYQRPHKQNKRWPVYFSAVSPFQHSNSSLTPPSKVPQSKGSGAADSAELQQEHPSPLSYCHLGPFWWQLSYLLAASQSTCRSEPPSMKTGDAGSGCCHRGDDHKQRGRWIWSLYAAGNRIHLGFSLVRWIQGWDLWRTLLPPVGGAQHNSSPSLGTC